MQKKEEGVRRAEGSMKKAKDDNQNFAKAILNVRRDNKLTQEQFAEKIGVTRQAVSRWEMGISVPNINTITLISEKFGVSIDVILKATENVTEKRAASIKKTRNYEFLLLFIGIAGLITLPFLAKWEQLKSMESFKTAYEHSSDYILEYPLSIILMFALLLIGLDIYIIIKKRR